MKYYFQGCKSTLNSNKIERMLLRRHFGKLFVMSYSVDLWQYESAIFIVLSK